MAGSIAAALPASLRHMAAECGLTAVMSFIQWRGNTRYYVPQQAVQDSHELVIRLGRKAADWLVANHGGETMIVPRAVDMLREQRNREICALRGQGKTAAEVALQYGLHERGVWRIWAEGDDGEAEGKRAQEGLF